MLKFQGWFDIHLHHLLQARIPVTKTCVFTCNNGQTWVTAPFGVGRTKNRFAQPPNHCLKDGAKDQECRPREG